MSPDVLRRKLQKKLKHKPYRKCPDCGERMQCKLAERGDGWHLWKHCGELFVRDSLVWCRPARAVNGTKLGCGYFKELFWSGGGTGRHIPHE